MKILEPLRYSVTTGPASEPVTTSGAKAWARIDISDDDSLVGSLITAARLHVENHTGQALIYRTIQWKLDHFPTVFRPPMPPLSSVTSITYTDPDGDGQTLATSVYTVDTTSVPGRIVEAYGQDWPATREEIDAVTVTYVAGFASAASGVPEPLITAIKSMVTHLYDNRSHVVVQSGIGAVEIPDHIRAMLAPYRVVNV